MKKYFALPLFVAGFCLSITCVAQQTGDTVEEEPTTTYSNSYNNKLPKDLPQSKLLFIKFSSVAVEKDLTNTMNKHDAANMLYHRGQFNSRIEDANKQLEEAAAHYPFTYHITTEDSVAYYKKQGYRYKFYSDSFGASVGAYYNHSTYQNPTFNSVEVYLKDLVNHDRYVFSHTDKDMVTVYKTQVGKLLRMIERQFGVKK